jgi:hypothetical protein
MKRGTYGKKPLWFWLAVYAVIGAGVYGLIYLALSGGGGAPGY